MGKQSGPGSSREVRAFLRLLAATSLRFYLIISIQACDGAENIVAMRVRIHARPHLYDLAGGRDKEGVALGKLDGAHTRQGNAVGVDDLVVGVGEQFEGERVFEIRRASCRGRV